MNPSSSCHPDRFEIFPMILDASILAMTGRDDFVTAFLHPMTDELLP